MDISCSYISSTKGQRYVHLAAFQTHSSPTHPLCPMQSAVIGLTDRIFTRVATLESAAVPQSSFMIDLSQVAGMLRHATERCEGWGRGGTPSTPKKTQMKVKVCIPSARCLCAHSTFDALSHGDLHVHVCLTRSLCIIDEFGKGTLAADGVGLLCGVLRTLSEQPTSPRVVLCTHFSEVGRWGSAGGRGELGVSGVRWFSSRFYFFHLWLKTSTLRAHTHRSSTRSTCPPPASSPSSP
jgi:hypothetical protein